MSNEMRVVPRGCQWWVEGHGCVLAGPFETHAQAWQWVGAHSDEGRADADRYNRIRITFSEK
jgi:hypothetical protein